LVNVVVTTMASRCALGSELSTGTSCQLLKHSHPSHWVLLVLSAADEGLFSELPFARKDDRKVDLPSSSVAVIYSSFFVTEFRLLQNFERLLNCKLRFVLPS
jgi:hypothetical protein